MVDVVVLDLDRAAIALDLRVCEGLTGTNGGAEYGSLRRRASVGHVRLQAGFAEFVSHGVTQFA